MRADELRIAVPRDELPVDRLGTCPRIDGGDDVLDANVNREHILAVVRFERVEDSLLTAGDYDRARGTVQGQPDEMSFERPVQIPLIVRQMLEVPHQLAGVRVECNRGVRIERVVTHQFAYTI